MQQFRLEPAACRVLGLWLFFPGAILAPFLFWQSFWLGAVFLVVWSILSLVLLPLRARSLRCILSFGEIRVDCGFLFKTSRRLPLRFVTGASRIGSPLLRWCGCSLLLIYSSGTTLVLPGLSNENTDLILSALEVGRL